MKANTVKKPQVGQLIHLDKSQIAVGEFERWAPTFSI